MIVVLLADKLGVVHHVELLPRHQLLATDEAGEALEVEDLVPGLPHQVLWGDALATATALGPVAPGKNILMNQKIFHRI